MLSKVDPGTVAGPAGPAAEPVGFRRPVPYRAVFEFLPSGVLITDSRGRVTGANLTSRKLLGDVMAGDGLRCCDLFGCRRPGTPLASNCIAELALSRPEPMPEVRVDVANRDGGTASVWVTASSMGDADS